MAKPSTAMFTDGLEDAEIGRIHGDALLRPRLMTINSPARRWTAYAITSLQRARAAMASR